MTLAFFRAQLLQSFKHLAVEWPSEPSFEPFIDLPFPFTETLDAIDAPLVSEF